MNSITNTEQNTTNTLSYAFGATALMALLITLFSSSGKIGLDYFIVIEAVAIFLPLYIMNHRIGRISGPNAFLKRLTLNSRYGLMLLGFFIGLQALAYAFFNLTLLSSSFERFEMLNGLPLVVMSMVTLAYVIISIFICMVLFRKRISSMTY